MAFKSFVPTSLLHQVRAGDTDPRQRSHQPNLVAHIQAKRVGASVLYACLACGTDFKYEVLVHHLKRRCSPNAPALDGDLTRTPLAVVGHVHSTYEKRGIVWYSCAECRELFPLRDLPRHLLRECLTRCADPRAPWSAHATAAPNVGHVKAVRRRAQTVFACSACAGEFALEEFARHAGKKCLEKAVEPVVTATSTIVANPKVTATSTIVANPKVADSNVSNSNADDPKVDEPKVTEPEASQSKSSVPEITLPTAPATKVILPTITNIMFPKCPHGDLEVMVAAQTDHDYSKAASSEAKGLETPKAPASNAPVSISPASNAEASNAPASNAPASIPEDPTSETSNSASTHSEGIDSEAQPASNARYGFVLTKASALNGSTGAAGEALVLAFTSYPATSTPPPSTPPPSTPPPPERNKYERKKYVRKKGVVTPSMLRRAAETAERRRLRAVALEAARLDNPLGSWVSGCSHHPTRRTCSFLCSARGLNADHLAGYVAKPMAWLEPDRQPLFQCDRCKNVFSAETFVAEHIRSQHPEAPEGDLGFSFIESLYERRMARRKAVMASGKAKALAKDRAHVCDQCGKVYVRRDLLRCHVEAAHEHHVYECDTCGKVFPSSLHMRAHFGLAHSRRHLCEVCGEGFAGVKSLRTHQLKHGARVRGNADHARVMAATCDICEAVLVGRASLLAHIGQHLGRSPMECVTCGEGFASRDDLVTHVRDTHGERVFACRACGSAYGSSQTLAQHERARHGPKKFACEFCGLACLSRGALVVHVRVHTGELPYACTHCDKRFRQSHHMYSHIRTHTGEKPYKCPMCEKRYTQNADRRFHLARVHGVENWKPRLVRRGDRGERLE